MICSLFLCINVLDVGRSLLMSRWRSVVFLVLFGLVMSYFELDLSV